MPLHKNLDYANNHVAHAYEYSAQATLLADTFNDVDVGKLALVDGDAVPANDGLYYLLKLNGAEPNTGDWRQLAVGASPEAEIYIADYGSGNPPTEAPSVDALGVNTNGTPTLYFKDSAGSWTLITTGGSGSGGVLVDNTDPSGVTDPGAIDAVHVEVDNLGLIKAFEEGTSPGTTWIDTSVTQLNVSGVSWKPGSGVPATNIMSEDEITTAIDGSIDDALADEINILHEVVIYPQDMMFDDTETGVDNNTVFNIFNTVAFDDTVDGAVWMNFRVPDAWGDLSSYNVFIQPAFVGTSVSSGTVDIDYELWNVEDGDTPTSISDQQSGSITSVAGTNFTGNQYVQDPAVLTFTANTGNELIDADSIVVKMTRNATGGDSYGGDLRVISIKFTIVAKP